jgi:hypothetical protein
MNEKPDIDYQSRPFPLDSCMDSDRGYVCKLKKGHAGDHLGADPSTVHCWRNVPMEVK